MNPIQSHVSSTANLSVRHPCQPCRQCLAVHPNWGQNWGQVERPLAPGPPHVRKPLARTARASARSSRGHHRRRTRALSRWDSTVCTDNVGYADTDLRVADVA